MAISALSKIIEALESVRDFKKKDPVLSPTSSSRSFQNQNLNIQDQEKKQPGASQYQMTQQELADVYFARSGKTAKPVPQPTLIRVEDKRRSYMLPWIVTTLALVICSLALFSTKRVMISIQVYDSDAPIQNSPSSRSSNVAAAGGSRQVRIEPDRFGFSAGAESSSLVGKDSVTLSNRANRDQAYAVVDFDPPFNAKGYALQFEAKGEIGGETLEVILSDIRRQSSLNAGAIRPFPTGLTTRWEKAEVRVPSGAGFDTSRIRQMRLDIGSRRTGNPSNTSIMIRNARWVPYHSE